MTLTEILAESKIYLMEYKIKPTKKGNDIRMEFYYMLPEYEGYILDKVSFDLLDYLRSNKVDVAEFTDKKTSDKIRYKCGSGNDFLELELRLKRFWEDKQGQIFWSVANSNECKARYLPHIKARIATTDSDDEGDKEGEKNAEHPLVLMLLKFKPKYTEKNPKPKTVETEKKE